MSHDNELSGSITKPLFKQTEIGIVPEDWNVDILSKHVEIIGGGTPKTTNDEYWNGEIPWISVVDFVGDKRWIYDTEKHITKKGLENSSTKLLHKGQIIISARGTVGELSQVTRDMAFNQSCYGFDGKNELDNNYLFYLLKLKVKELQQKGHGAVFNTITKETFNQIMIPIPRKAEQQAMAKVLSDLDSKNLLNRQVNVTLEAISQAIFNHWFVDFEFPNQEGKPYKLSGGEMVYNKELDLPVPKDWHVESLGNILSLLKDGTHTPPKRVESGIKFIAGATDLKHFDVDFAKCTYIKEEDYYAIHKYWKLEANDVLLTIVGTIGNVAIVEEQDLPFSLQRSIAVLRAGNKISFQFLYFLLNSRSFKQFLLTRVNPTAQPGVYLGTLSGYKVCIPTKEVVDRFTGLMAPVISKMQKNNLELSLLTQIRDALLPKLMSGRIRAPLADENVRVQ